MLPSSSGSIAGPSASNTRQHLSVTILELSSSPGTGGYGLDSDPEKLSFLSNVSAGGLEPPIVMTPGGASPERRESNNSTRSTRSCLQQQNRSSGSDVILADNNSDTYGPGGELHGYSRCSGMKRLKVKETALGRRQIGWKDNIKIDLGNSFRDSVELLRMLTKYLLMNSENV